MKDFDYIRDPIDFCLYPNEIVERFANKEVIVYATKDAGNTFVDAFKDKLRIKYVANLKWNNKLNTFFVAPPPLNVNKGTSPVINLDDLVAIREEEPIFVMSHIWITLTTHLKKKGLVLGKDIFFWDYGYPKTELVDKFIEHNIRLWRSEKIESENRVLIPLSTSSAWFEAGRSVPNAYVGNYLAKRYNARISFCMHSTATVRGLIYKHKTARDVYRSFNATDIFDLATKIVCDEQQLKKAKKIFELIISKINSWHDLRNIEIEGIEFGNDFIRDYCRYYVPPLDLKTPHLTKHLLWAVQHVIALADYFKQHNDIKAVVLCDGVSRSGYLRDVAIANEIPTYALDYGSCHCKLDMGWPNNRHYEYYKKFFEQLSPKEQTVGIEWGRRSLNARLAGEKKEIAYMPTSIYEIKPGERVLEQNDKIKVLICPHTLYDDVQCGWQVFGCMMAWLIHLGELSNTTDYDWYLKLHPISLSLERDTVFGKEYVKRYPRIKLIPPLTSPKQLKAEGLKFAFTVYGTLGHEYPALGIQVINAGNNPHVAFDFCYNPRTPKEFDNLVSRLPELTDRDIDMQEIYKFYCVHFLYYKRSARPVQDMFFKRPELYPFAFNSATQKNRSVSDLVKRFQYYLDDWTPDFHEITKHKVEERFFEMNTRRDEVFYKNDEAVIQAKLEAVGMTLD